MGHGQLNPIEVLLLGLAALVILLVLFVLAAVVFVLLTDIL